jgi:hypothetical protein
MCRLVETGMTQTTYDHSGRLLKHGDEVVVKCHDEGYVGQRGKIVAVFESGRCQVAVGVRPIALLNLPPEGMIKYEVFD